MNRTVIIFIATIMGVLNSFARNWEKDYLLDDFGDPDYSRPAYGIQCESTQYRGSHIKILYVNGAFALNPVHSLIDVNNAASLKAKAPDGSVYEFDIDKTHRKSGIYWITQENDVNTLVNLLERGNFTLSFHRPADYYDEAFNYNYKIGKQGQGIRAIYNADASDTRVIPQTAPDTYKGAIGKYKITMQLDAPYATPDGKYSVSGVYWYGDGKNGRMTLRGHLTYDANWKRIFDFTEYDPQGKKCGSFHLTEGYNPTTQKTSLKGTMTNKAGTIYNVSLEQY